MARVGDFERFVFVVGAPRCGTTTIANFLKTHPSVSFPSVKEPHFFAHHDLRNHSQVDLEARVERDYLGRFFRCESGRVVGADASVTYLYTPEQMMPVLRLWPDARFVVALRNPLHMLPSLHKRLIYLGDETIHRFEDAWAAAPARAAGRRIPRGCVEPRWLRYHEAGRFGTYLERLFAAVGRDRCLVVVLDDLAADPPGQYSKIMHFAGLVPAGQVSFDPQREGRDVRWPWLQRVLKRPPQRTRTFLAGEQFRQRERDLDRPDTVGKITEAVFAMRKKLLRWNRIPSRREPLSTDLQRELANYYEPEIRHLGVLVGRDFSEWLDAPQRAEARHQALERVVYHGR
ncbi:MAG TPA: sulfotransferase [Sphingomicrobium sp.]